MAALAAGCDLALFCPGRIDESRAVLQAVPPLAPSLLARLDGVLAALAGRPGSSRSTPIAAAARLAELLGGTVA